MFCCVHRLVSACWASLPSCKNSTLQTSNHYSCHRVQSSPFIPRWAPAVAEQLLFKCLLLVVPPFISSHLPFSFPYLSHPFLSFCPLPCLIVVLFSLYCTSPVFFLSFSLHVIISYTVYSFHFPLSFHLSHSFSSSQLLVFFHYLFDYLLSIFFSSLTSSLSSFWAWHNLPTLLYVS